MAHAHERIEAIRRTAAANLITVEELESNVKDPYMLRQLKSARHWFEDVENFFLSSLSKQSRTADEESKWLLGAEWALHMGQLMLKGTQDIVAKYGTDVVFH